MRLNTVSRERQAGDRHEMVAPCLARLLCVAAIATVLWAPPVASALFSGARSLAAGVVGLLTLLVVSRPAGGTLADPCWSGAGVWCAPVAGGATQSTALAYPAARTRTHHRRAARMLGGQVVLVVATLVAVALAGGWDGPLAPLTVLPALLFDTSLGVGGALLLAGGISLAAPLLILGAAPLATPVSGATSPTYAAILGPATWAVFAAMVFWVRVQLVRRQRGGPSLAWHAADLGQATGARALAQASHELLTPLAAIQAGAGLLAEPGGLLGGSADAVDPAAVPAVDGRAPNLVVAQRVAGNVWRNAARLSLLLEDVLELARWHEAAPRLKRQWHACAPVLRRAADAVDLLCASRSQRVLWAANPPDLPFWGDAGRMEQVLVNLLANAHKYAGEWASITVVARPWEDGVRWEVCDDGPGLNARSRSRAVDPDRWVAGYPLKPASSGDTASDPSGAAGSHGLGLAVVTALVTLHGGSLWGENLREHGCRFVVWLPGCPSGAADQIGADTASAARSECREEDGDL